MEPDKHEGRSHPAKDTAQSEEESLGRRAYRVLRRALRDGIIQPDRYYSETELAQLLGVSRTPVREALKRLERDGVLVVAHRKGYRLRTFTEAEVEELVELRKVLERFAIGTLIERATERDLETLSELFERQTEDDVDDRIFALDEEFHLAIAKLAGLPRTAETLAALRSAMAVIGAGAYVPGSRTKQVVEEHRQLLGAILGRDKQTAAELLDRHVEASTQALLEGKRRHAERRFALRLAGGSVGSS